MVQYRLFGSHGTKASSVSIQVNNNSHHSLKKCQQKMEFEPLKTFFFISLNLLITYEILHRELAE